MRSSSQRIIARKRNLDRRAYLRPMTDAQINDAALHFYRNHAWKLIRETFVPSLVFFVGIAQIFTFLVPRMFLTASPDQPMSQLVEFLIAMGISTLFAIPLTLAGVTHTFVVASKTIGNEILGPSTQSDVKQHVSFQDTLRVLRAALPALLWLFIPLAMATTLTVISGLASSMGSDDVSQVLAGAAAVGACFIAIISVPYAVSRIIVLIPVIVHEKIDVKDGFRRADFLMRKNGNVRGGRASIVNHLTTAVILFVVMNATFAIGISMLAFIPYLEPFLNARGGTNVIAGAVESLPTYLATVVLVPFSACYSTLVYFERRARVEALDVYLIAEDMKLVSQPSGNS